VILADQMRALAWAEREAELIGVAPFNVLEEVREELAVLLGID
jgi:hypothetical protein